MIMFERGFESGPMCVDFLTTQVGAITGVEKGSFEFVLLPEDKTKEHEVVTFNLPATAGRFGVVAAGYDNVTHNVSNTGKFIYVDWVPSSRR